MKIVLTPNIFLKSGSLNLKGMFDTWSLLGVLSPCLLACTETTADWESAWLTAQDWDCCWAAAIAAAAAAAREVATSWEPSSPWKLQKKLLSIPFNKLPCCKYQYAILSQLISECLFGALNFPKNQRKIWQISALETKKSYT